MKKFIGFLLCLCMLSACILSLNACGGHPAEQNTIEATTQAVQTDVQTIPSTIESETTEAVTPIITEEQITGEQLHISIEVVHGDEPSKIFPLTTVCTNLADALTSSGIADGKIEDYGFTIYTVDGITADFNTSNAYWAISVNGEPAQTGASFIELVNEGIYTLTYTTY